MGKVSKTKLTGPFVGPVVINGFKKSIKTKRTPVLLVGTRTSVVKDWLSRNFNLVTLDIRSGPKRLNSSELETL